MSAPIDLSASQAEMQEIPEIEDQEVLEDVDYDIASVTVGMLTPENVALYEAALKDTAKLPEKIGSFRKLLAFIGIDQEQFKATDLGVSNSDLPKLMLLNYFYYGQITGQSVDLNKDLSEALEGAAIAKLKKDQQLSIINSCPELTSLFKSRFESGSGAIKSTTKAKKNEITDFLHEKYGSLWISEHDLNMNSPSGESTKPADKPKTITGIDKFYTKLIKSMIDSQNIDPTDQEIQGLILMSLPTFLQIFDNEQKSEGIALKVNAFVTRNPYNEFIRTHPSVFNGYSYGQLWEETDPVMFRSRIALAGIAFSPVEINKIRDKLKKKLSEKKAAGFRRASKPPQILNLVSAPSSFDEADKFFEKKESSENIEEVKAPSPATSQPASQTSTRPRPLGRMPAHVSRTSNKFA